MIKIYLYIKHNNYVIACVLEFGESPAALQLSAFIVKSHQCLSFVFSRTLTGHRCHHGWPIHCYIIQNSLFSACSVTSHSGLYRQHLQIWYDIDKTNEPTEGITFIINLSIDRSIDVRLHFRVWQVKSMYLSSWHTAAFQTCLFSLLLQQTKAFPHERAVPCLVHCTIVSVSAGGSTASLAHGGKHFMKIV